MSVVGLVLGVFGGPGCGSNGKLPDGTGAAGRGGAGGGAGAAILSSATGGSAGTPGDAGGTAGQGGNAGTAGATMDAGAGPLVTIAPTEAQGFIGQGVPTQPDTFILTNLGSAPSGPFTVTISGSTCFKITFDTCSTHVLGPGEMCRVDVVFDAPGGVGSVSGSMEIAADGIPGGSFALYLYGDAV
jgi:hypothetical protein